MSAGSERHRPCLLRRGDLALVSHGAGHRLISGAGVPVRKLFDLPRDAISNRYEVLRHAEGGAATTMICAFVRFDHPAAHQLICGLPRLICVDTWKSPETEWLRSMLRFIAAEAQHPSPGGETVITRLDGCRGKDAFPLAVHDAMNLESGQGRAD